MRYLSNLMDYKIHALQIIPLQEFSLQLHGVNSVEAFLKSQMTNGYFTNCQRYIFTEF